MLGPLRFAHLLAILLLVGFCARLAYVLGQAASDPAFALPILDGAYYVEWARSLAAGRAGPLGGHPGESGSAFYLAPLYPLFLAGIMRVFGENYALIYYAQQLLMILTAAFIGLAGRRLSGDWAGPVQTMIGTIVLTRRREHLGFGHARDSEPGGASAAKGRGRFRRDDRQDECRPQNCNVPQGRLPAQRIEPKIVGAP